MVTQFPRRTARRNAFLPFAVPLENERRGLPSRESTLRSSNICPRDLVTGTTASGSNQAEAFKVETVFAELDGGFTEAREQEGKIGTVNTFHGLRPT